MTPAYFVKQMMEMFPYTTFYDPADLAARRLHVATLKGNHGQLSMVAMEFEGSPPRLPIIVQYLVSDEPTSASLYVNRHQVRRIEKKVCALDLITRFLKSRGYLRDNLQLIRLGDTD